MRNFVAARLTLSLVVAACADDVGSGGTGGALGGGVSDGGSTGEWAGGAGSGSGGASSPGGGAPTGCFDYASFTPTAVSFQGDVMPIFAARCQECHDDTTASTYYGADAAIVHDKLLNGVPNQAPHLAFVAPNDPLRSYMLAKVEYPIPGGTCSEVQCNEPGCELSAPPGNPLPEGERAVLRSWIMNGAAND